MRLRFLRRRRALAMATSDLVRRTRTSTGVNVYRPDACRSSMKSAAASITGAQIGTKCCFTIVQWLRRGRGSPLRYHFAAGDPKELAWRPSSP